MTVRTITRLPWNMNGSYRYQVTKEHDGSYRYQVTKEHDGSYRYQVTMDMMVVPLPGYQGIFKT